jgi:hypothetical protein
MFSFKKKSFTRMFKKNKISILLYFFYIMFLDLLFLVFFYSCIKIIYSWLFFISTFFHDHNKFLFKKKNFW